MTASIPLGALSPEEFLRDYWQKRPLLIRNAIPGFESPISPEELAGLACEEEINARLILERGGRKPWEVRHGPFSEELFMTLPEDGYSLLVTDCEKAVPELMEIVQAFRFVPDWRIDDLMISYAPPGGSVGAHIDQYDVFLLQAHGTRKWMIESRPRPEVYVPGLDVRILETFEPDEEWLLEPGDLLYLPPGIPHHGVALTPCMTWSIGFRAPRAVDVVSGVADMLIDRLDPAALYTDPDRSLQDNPGALAAADLARFRRQVREALTADDDLIDRLIARVLTDRRVDLAPFYPGNEPMDTELLGALLEAGHQLMRTPAVRMALVENGAGAFLMVDGEETRLCERTRPLAEYLTRSVFLDSERLLAALEDEEAGIMLAALYAHGALMWVDPTALEDALEDEVDAPDDGGED
ncbi:MAG: cupin domain-containing protein [Halothiobacillaceae bacterium]